MTCEIHGRLTICRSDLKREVFGRTKKRWCFKCRKHLVHDKVMFSEILKWTDKGELINGYYEPFVKYECRNCKEEHLEFGS